MTSDNTSLATLKYIGEPPERAKLSGATAVAQNGIFYYHMMNPVFRPGTENRLEVDIQLNEDYARIVPFLNGTARYNILFKARECEVGEKFTETYECLTCDQYTYSFTPLKDPSACPPCPQYGDCLDGNLYPEPGYVRMTDTSEVFVRCSN